MSAPTEKPRLELQLVTVVARHGLRTPSKLLSSDKSSIWSCDLNKMSPPAQELVHFFDHFNIHRIDEDGDKTDETSKPHNHSQSLKNDVKVDQKMLLLPRGNCKGGQLTVNARPGHLQMIRLGEKYAQRYATYDNQFRLLDPEYDPSEVYLRSTPSKRTMESVQSVMFGMYGKANHPNFTVHVKDKKDENMYPDKSCTSLFALRDEIKKSTEFTEGEATFQKKLLEEVKDEDVRNRINRGAWIGMENTLHSLERHRWPHPIVSQTARDTITSASGWYAKMLHGGPTTIRLGIGRFMSDVLKVMQGKVDGLRGKETEASRIRFAYFSGHDNTLIPLMNGLGIYMGHPPMGSHLEFEMYKKIHTKSVSSSDEDKPPVMNNSFLDDQLKGSNKEDLWIRVLFNDEERTLPKCKTKQETFNKSQFLPRPEGDEEDQMTLCPWNTFHDILTKHVPANYKEECQMKADKMEEPFEE
ncbi:hypothetical protein PROFUN_00459 [Planoprotostelium fungivorum]|uniref:Acid phosphatase n=1 Tax=Planoprotostelium fungivorum TaxID=1890364 RepID=A0A2P6N0V7_9EUKA|nr:hypothetical protein PROFUN_00459 [Planoprotostelium fungivorum]